MAKRASTSSRLATYAAKRDFTQTPEPPPKTPKKPEAMGKLSFCVQKHLASALHYDFRLEHDGILLSWAVPKGPSLNPADKRLAMRTEDHPLDYGGFEGVIPTGYGAGIVVLWDRGTWEPENGDVAAALAKGELKFQLHGEKLSGSFVLVRTRSFGGREQWLLIKHRDASAGERDITLDEPTSVKTGRDFAGVLAASKDRKAFLAHAHERGGQAGAILKQAIADAAAGRDSPAAAAAVETPRRGKARSTSATDGGHAKTWTPTTTRKAIANALGSAQKKRSRKQRNSRNAPSSASDDTDPAITNPDKVLFPATGFTKGQLVDYYSRVAPLILPHLRGRWVTLKRYPDGVGGKFFFERRCPKHCPDWVRTTRVELETKDDAIDYCVIDDLRTLRWVANLAAIELHVPMSCADDPATPTAMVFDLDPGPPAGLSECITVALRLKRLLERHGLISFVKGSGSKVIHLMVPLNAPGANTFEHTKAFAHAAALELQEQDPKLVTTSVAKADRTGKVFIDYSQNDPARTMVCVYSVRAKEQPTVSTPWAWEDLAKTPPKVWSAARPIPAVTDPFKGTLTMRQTLPEFQQASGGEDAATTAGAKRETNASRTAGLRSTQPRRAGSRLDRRDTGSWRNQDEAVARRKPRAVPTAPTSKVAADRTDHSSAVRSSK